MSSGYWRWSVSILLVCCGACAEPPTVVVQPLRVINWSPAGGAVCVDTVTKVLVTFSDDIELSTLTPESLRVVTADGNAVASTLGYDKTTLTASLTFAAPFEFDRVYNIVIDDTVESANQGQLGVELSSSFQTIKRTGCTRELQCQLPSDCPGTQVCSSTGVCIDQCRTDRDCPSGRTCQDGSCG